MIADSRIIIGLGGSNHEGSAALLRESSIEVAIEQERLTRRKHGHSWWWENPVGAAVEYCLESAHVSIDDVARFVSSDLLPKRVIEQYHPKCVRLFPHHLCHAASACLMLPPKSKAAFLVYDGMGSIRSKPNSTGKVLRETFSFFELNERGLDCLGQTFGESLVEHDDFPSGCSNSIGKIYDMATAILGFDEADAGKTMGLAAHGKARYADEIMRFLKRNRDFSSCFEYDASDPSLSRFLRGCVAGSSEFGVKADVAASIQSVLEKTLLHAFSLFKENHQGGLILIQFVIRYACVRDFVLNSQLSKQFALGKAERIPNLPQFFREPSRSWTCSTHQSDLLMGQRAGAVL
jgi:carbamoyltransferase